MKYLKISDNTYYVGKRYLYHPQNCIMRKMPLISGP